MRYGDVVQLTTEWRAQYHEAADMRLMFVQDAPTTSGDKCFVGVLLVKPDTDIEDMFEVTSWLAESFEVVP